MAQRSIELFIGKLVTDESFRAAFLRDAKGALERFAETGHELTAFEISALSTIPADVWESIAEKLDPRLQKASLHTW